MARTAKPKTRYEQIKKLNITDMAGFCSWYFGCDRCPADNKPMCQENDAMCMDAIKGWLNQEGNL